MTFKSDAAKIAVAVLGLAIAAAGGFFLWRYMQPPQVIDRHVIYAFSLWIAVGCTLIAPKQILAALKQLIALLPSIKIGGNGTPTP